MKISYNSPVVLTFALLSFGVLCLGHFHPEIVKTYFTAFGQGGHTTITGWSSMFLYVFGHANLDHFVGNMMLFLLLGPVLEEKYGSWLLAGMIAVTAIATSLANAYFLPTGIIGASGIVFMMIILVSITNVRDGSIPLTLILVSVLYVGREVSLVTNADNISRFAHIFGGGMGGVLGLLVGPLKKVSS